MKTRKTLGYRWWALKGDLRTLWRDKLGWLPIQPCIMCKNWYWGGFPRFELRQPRDLSTNEPIGRRKWQCVGKAEWADFCSTKCCDEDHEMYF